MSVPSLFSLEGRVALVTGASSGLGVTFARALADAGADVVLAARRVDRLEEVAAAIREGGRRALPVACDVTDPEQVEDAVAAAVAEFGRIDVLIANAGSVPEGFSMPERLPAELFARSIDVNLNGTWNTCQSVGRQMLRQGGGSIVIISSYAGLAGVPHFPPAYQAAKAALINISKSLAVSWADRGIRVNALAPGWFPSEMTDLVLSAPAFLARITDQAPLGPPGQARGAGGRPAAAGLRRLQLHDRLDGHRGRRHLGVGGLHALQRGALRPPRRRDARRARGAHHAGRCRVSETAMPSRRVWRP